MALKHILEKTKSDTKIMISGKRTTQTSDLMCSQLPSLPSPKHKRCKDIITWLQLKSPLKKVVTPLYYITNKISPISNTQFINKTNISSTFSQPHKKIEPIWKFPLPTIAHSLQSPKGKVAPPLLLLCHIFITPHSHNLSL